MRRQFRVPTHTLTTGRCANELFARSGIKDCNFMRLFLTITLLCCWSIGGQANRSDQIVLNFYLLTPIPGETRIVTGEFAPLLQEGKRFLQATGKADEFWAAIPDREKDPTQIGRYNLKSFSFTPVLTVPHINFDSMSLWVD